eukprot:scaffold5798_cov105-Isochrysis_galbana.AAC.5
MDRGSALTRTPHTSTHLHVQQPKSPAGSPTAQSRTRTCACRAAVPEGLSCLSLRACPAGRYTLDAEASASVRTRYGGYCGGYDAPRGCAGYSYAVLLRAVTHSV